jgi:hypothetical protein
MNDLQALCALPRSLLNLSLFELHEKTARLKLLKKWHKIENNGNLKNIPLKYYSSYIAIRVCIP